MEFYERNSFLPRRKLEKCHVCVQSWQSYKDTSTGFHFLRTWSRNPCSYKMSAMRRKFSWVRSVEGSIYRQKIIWTIWNEEGGVDKKFGGNEHENSAMSLISTILPGTCARFYIQLHYCNKLEKIWNSPSTLREDFRSAALTMITWEHLTSNTGVGLTESYGSFWQLNSITGVEEHKVFFLTGRNEQCDNWVSTNVKTAKLKEYLSSMLNSYPRLLPSKFCLAVVTSIL